MAGFLFGGRVSDGLQTVVGRLKTTAAIVRRQYGSGQMCGGNGMPA
ncbi:hypothetical protein [Kingella potus]|nr:hypothetical protein [Kingella potus]